MDGSEEAASIVGAIMLGTVSRGAVSAFAALCMMGNASAGGRGHAGAPLRPVSAAHGSVTRAGFGLHVAGPGRSVGGVARGLPPLAGVIHERGGRPPYFTSYGHLDTASPRLAGRSVWRPGFERRPNDIGRERRGFDARYADGRRRAYPLVGGSAYPYGGGYDGTNPAGGDYSAAYGGSTAGTAATLASEPPLSSYAEPPLGPSPYASPGDYGYAPEGIYPMAGPSSGAGPQIIIVNNVGPSRPPACPCSRRAASPVVYRYGVPAPY